MGLELSLKELPALERRGLGNGFKFLKSSIKIPAPEIVAAAEEGSSRLLLDQKGMVRSEVDHIQARMFSKQGCFQSAFELLRRIRFPNKGR